MLLVLELLLLVLLAAELVRANGSVVRRGEVTLLESSSFAPTTAVEIPNGEESASNDVPLTWVDVPSGGVGTRDDCCDVEVLFILESGGVDVRLDVEDEEVLVPLSPKSRSRLVEEEDSKRDPPESCWVRDENRAWCWRRDELRELELEPGGEPLDGVAVAELAEIEGGERVPRAVEARVVVVVAVTGGIRAARGSL